jgi:serine/threonine protein kinase
VSPARALPNRSARASPSATHRPSPGKGKQVKRICPGSAVKEGAIGQQLPVDLLLMIFSYMVESDAMENATQVCRKWRDMCNDRSIWKQVKIVLDNGTVNWSNFRKLAQKSKGTEGTCHKCLCRSTGDLLAVKRARVFPKGEGVAYYMLRELAVLQDMQHPHINQLHRANLANDKLHIFFPFIERTLQDVLVGNNGGVPANNCVSIANADAVSLSAYQVKRLLHQLLDATAFCHRRGVYHRNLKPKHLLIETPPDGNLDHAVLKVADFALVRSSGLPRRTYTAKVVTLWYRAPEILMGVTRYSHAVDTWSVGCVFAEMVLGRPLFTGSSEIDQLFQLFSTLGTPTEETWPGFSTLPNYGFAFPNWPGKPMKKIVGKLCLEGQDLLKKLLKYKPEQRISVEEALLHPFFTNIEEPHQQLVPAIPMGSIIPKGYESEVYYLHGYYREAEKVSWPMPQYLTGKKSVQPDMLPDHRSMLVDWLVELVDVFDMYLRSAFLAVAYTDLFLSRQEVGPALHLHTCII